MTMMVLLHARAAKELEKLGPAKVEIRKKLKKLEQNYRLGKQLRHSNFRSLRVGDYRAIYEVNKKENQVIVLTVGHRKNVYDDFTKLI
ncbi:type II toxin-antitoxin system RelE/ParE family toxin [archaeon]|nr:type II toxin-antitoxin system RelE/ParE family toxin [archaeon]